MTTLAINATFLFDGETFTFTHAEAERKAYALVSQGYEFIIRRSPNQATYEIYKA